MHDVALPWLQRARAKSDTGLVAAHSVAELYAVLTALPLRPRVTPEIALQVIERDVLDVLEVVPLSGQDYHSVITSLAEMRVVGGATYDALILQAARKAGAEQLVTLNQADFRRLAPDWVDSIVSP
ncbi:MAG: PIN domain-containing protein [Anaerolineae bacterium]|nr:PIN domain-containing protein [Anaerolineae bacterium]